ncbi:unnamed protein product [Candida verbasci]|uniref:Flo11 domain-containing protein n=1 Tax=Candida verbasci TaxID=1227364 RepID=A0A9W4XBF8_9ASCO|nr:unnamed protein product [Candida verbasci]
MKLASSQLFTVALFIYSTQAFWFLDSIFTCFKPLPQPPKCSAKQFYADLSSHSNAKRSFNANLDAAFVISDAEKNADGTYSVVGNFKVNKEDQLHSFFSDKVKKLTLTGTGVSDVVLYGDESGVANPFYWSAKFLIKPEYKDGKVCLPSVFQIIHDFKSGLGLDIISNVLGTDKLIYKFAAVEAGLSIFDPLSFFNSQLTKREESEYDVNGFSEIIDKRTLNFFIDLLLSIKKDILFKQICFDDCTPNSSSSDTSTTSSAPNSDQSSSVPSSDQSSSVPITSDGSSSAPIDSSSTTSSAPSSDQSSSVPITSDGSSSAPIDSSSTTSSAPSSDQSSSFPSSDQSSSFPSSDQSSSVPITSDGSSSAPIDSSSTTSSAPNSDQSSSVPSSDQSSSVPITSDGSSSAPITSSSATSSVPESSNQSFSTSESSDFSSISSNGSSAESSTTSNGSSVSESSVNSSTNESGLTSSTETYESSSEAESNNSNVASSTSDFTWSEGIVTVPSSTVTNIQTTVVTITTCHEDKCHETAVTTGLTTVTDLKTTYTTYCPIPEESSSLALPTQSDTNEIESSKTIETTQGVESSKAAETTQGVESSNTTQSAATSFPAKVQSSDNESNSEGVESTTSQGGENTWLNTQSENKWSNTPTTVFAESSPAQLTTLSTETAIISGTVSNAPSPEQQQSSSGIPQQSEAPTVSVAEGSGSKVRFSIGAGIIAAVGLLF